MTAKITKPTAKPAAKPAARPAKAPRAAKPQAPQAPQARIEALIESEDWLAAEAAIAEALESSPASHWLMARMALARYEQRQYAQALRWAGESLALQPTCPLALWERAGALDMLGRDAEAAEAYSGIIARGVDGLTKDPCNEGRAWAEGLWLDCFYRAGRVFARMGQDAQAAAFFHGAVSLLERGFQGVYPAAKIVAASARLPLWRGLAARREAERDAQAAVREAGLRGVAAPVPIPDAPGGDEL